MKWTNTYDSLPPIGKRVLATDGQVVGEAYITAVGSTIVWHRSFNVTWESWARNKPVIAWAMLPTYEEE